ncbi:DNA ligase 1 isoform X2 [Calliphora vicina]|uniref:DNA ligase 1 isoform X2 n=1 Tax=Calliphora vicina TaxID=7373 RepID=UPI00325A92BB
MGENASFTMFVEINSQRIPLHIGQWYLLGKQINGSESKANNFIKLDDGEDVEQKHCIIYVGHTEEVFVFDLFSSKGTLVNNTALKGSEMLRLKNGDIVKVGNKEIKYIHDQREMSHDSSGFLDDNKNTSDIIASSPDSTSQHESRVKRANYNNFLVPSIPPKKSVTPNTSFVIAETEATNTSRNSLNSSSNSLNSTNRRSDSFTIPETQYCGGPRSSLNASDLSVAESTPDVSGNKIKFNFGNLDDLEDDDEDFCIPETQELLPVAGITSSQRPRILSDGQFQDKSILLEESKNEAEDTNNVDGSQFRICTQDYNEGFGEEANQSEYSQIIPLIKHPLVILNNSAKSSKNNSRNQSKTEEDEKEMSALKWSNSKLDQETTALRADCSTPDILDFEELQQEATSMKANTEKSANKSNIEPPPNLLDEDDEDLLPTQVFLPSAPIQKPTKKNSFIVPEKDCVVKENEEILTLSDKENRCPVTLEPLTDFPPTQLFATDEVPTARSTTSSTSRNSLTAPAVENKNNSKSLHNLDPDEEDDMLTQAFLQPTNLPSTSNHKNIPVKCFNSTVLEDKFMSKNPATFFAEMEKTPLKQNASLVTNFKMPDKDFTVLRKTSSATSTTESDVDLLMCTPQLIKEHIHMDKGEDLKKNILALFGDDSDAEESEEESEGDLVKLINIPKDTLDFDKLLPHLNKKPKRSKISEEATAAKEAQKLHKFNIFLGNEQDEKRTKSDHSRSTTLSRDERHMARDKERELADSKERTNKTKANTSKGKKAKQTETTHQEDEQNSSNRSEKNKEDEQKSSNKSGKSKKDEQKSSNKPGKTKKDEQRSSNKTGKSKEDEPKSSNKTVKSKEDEPKSSNKPGNNKEDEQKKSGKNKEDEQKSLDKPEKSTRQRKRQASSDKLDKSKEAKKEEPVKEMPARRMTRAKSRNEETASTSKDAASSKNSKSTQDEQDDLDSIATQPFEDDELDSICTQPFVRVTRCRSRSKQSESQESITTNNSKRKNAQQNKSKNDSSSSHNASVNGNMTTKTTGDQRKRKAEATPPVVPEKIERKRLRSTDSSVTSNNSSSASSTISISMTMVDQELFKNLVQNSKGFWNIAKNPLDSEVLVMDKAFRTFKFLLAMARGIPIVTSEYLKKMNKSTTGKKVRINDYLFADAEFEKKHKFSLDKSLQMAKQHKLFKGYEFVMTASILPNPQEIKTIIEVSGGYVHAKTPPAPKDNQHIYLVTAKEDKKEWHKYRRLNKNIIIVSTEAIMSAVMRQNCERMTSYTLS